MMLPWAWLQRDSDVEGAGRDRSGLHIDLWICCCTQTRPIHRLDTVHDDLGLTHGPTGDLADYRGLPPIRKVDYSNSNVVLKLREPITGVRKS